MSSMFSCHRYVLAPFFPSFALEFKVALQLQACIPAGQTHEHIFPSISKGIPHAFCFPSILNPNYYYQPLRPHRTFHKISQA
jgi:hypothetical protein